MPTESDRAWLEAALDQHEGALLRYAASLVGRTAARDVVQDTFLTLCRTSPERVAGRLAPWLFVVCKHHALQTLRKGRRLAPLDDEEIAPEGEPWRRVEAQPSVKQIEALIDQLPDKQRQAVILKFSGGLSYKEIADVMGVSVTHVGVLLHTALSKVRATLEAPAAAHLARSPA
jgi:RNA polymerase sigma-70 factor (ECF subfamily)